MIDLTALTNYFASKGPVVLLESQSDDHPWSQKSYLAALPKAEIKARDHHISVTEKDKGITRVGNPWEALQRFREKHNSWLFGYLGYDLKNYLEELESPNFDQVQAPDLYFMVPGVLLEIDRTAAELKVLTGSLPTDSEFRTGSGLEECRLQNLRYQISQDDYLGIIKEAQHHIEEGDCYEINLSHQMVGDFHGSPLKLYKKMKQIGPVPFGAYIKTQDFAVCSQSPERFLRKDGSTVFSQPIKGTSKRGGDANIDEKFKQRLLSSAKERAENLMIVDLVRNDLGRIAQLGTVEVPELFNIQSFETVHQMVSTVRAEAKEEDPLEILKSCFPMGSMTGAPKISAMKIIDELEHHRRGIYSGAIGYITPDDNFDFNVVIRTAIIRNNKLYYSVGGAITGDSDPMKEWEETKLKARALLDVLKSEEVA